MKEKRKYILINSKFQLKCILYTACLCILFYLLNLFLITYEFDAELSELLSTTLIYNLLLLLVVSILTLFQSHRIAGPVKALEIYLTKKAQEKPSPVPSFRTKDFFKGLYPLLLKVEAKEDGRKESSLRIKKFLSQLTEENDQEKRLQLMDLIQSEVDYMKK